MDTTKKGRNIKIEFDSYQDIINYLDGHEKNKYRHSVSYDRPDFCKYSYNESINMLRSGWADGVKEVDSIATQIKDKISDNSSYSIQYDVTGDYIDIGAYLSGQPECFGYLEPIEGPKREVDILVNITYSCDISQKTIYNRGAAITALIDKLQETHFVNLRLIQKVSDRNGNFNHHNFELVFNVNTTNEYSRDLLCFYLANSAFLRRIIFGIEENYLSKDCLGGYGRITQPKIPKDTIYFPELQWEHNCSQWQSIETSTTEVERIINQYNGGE